MLRANAKYEFGLEFARILPLNDDQSIPGPENIFGGTGPFDFSEVADDTAVVLKVKDDSDTVQDLTVDVSPAVDVSAVTVAELVTALNITFTALDYTASSEAGKDGSTRLKIVSEAVPLPSIVQVYGEFAEIALFGQGAGLKYVKFDTLQTSGLSPVLKEDEVFTTTDAGGLDTEVRVLGYQKGETVTVTDAASNDPTLLLLIAGYTYDSTTDKYTSGTASGNRVAFLVEFFWSYYSQGSSQEADLVGYRLVTMSNCTAVQGEETHERGFTAGNFTINALNYKDSSGNEVGAKSIEELSIADFTALDLENV
jgi:hypothetical protein